MTNKGAQLKNQIHPTMETLGTEETPFDRSHQKPQKKLVAEVAPQNERHEDPVNLQNEAPQYINTVEEIESPQTLSGSPPSFMKKPKVYLKPLPLDKLKKNGD